MGLLDSLKKTKQSMRQWTWHHATVFILTFFSYAFFHACRKAFSNIKDSMEKSFSPMNASMFPYDTWQKETLFHSETKANVFLGELDTLFLFAYAIGLFFFGMLGDRVNLKAMLTVGMCGSAILTFLFGYLSAILGVRNLWYYRCIYCLNGLFQATGWPATVAIMGNWFSKKSGGLVFGFWSGNASTGNILGSLIVASVLHYGYEYGMLLNSMLLFCGGILISICLIVHPNEVGLEAPSELENKENFKTSKEGIVNDQLTSSSDTEIHLHQPTHAISFVQALLIPGVIPYSLSYACLKLVNYTFFFWLPTYLSQGLHWDDSLADKLSNFYDIGGIAGGILAGIITDVMGVRSPVVGLMLLLSTVSLYLYNAFGTTYTSNVALMIVTGFLIGGPANTISTAITADLGKHEKIRGSAEALSTVTGIIDGTGSIGAAIGQYLVPVINQHLGWQYVFYFLILMTAMSLFCIIPMLYCELKQLIRNRSGEVDYQSVRNEES